jgi:3'-phosphoadenosine 5'-phosphosulfate sulfotransferase (PAPS reductase)/FAD synthetase
MGNAKGDVTRSIRLLDENAWLEGMEFLLSMHLEGLQVLCPECKRMGVATPKWVKGGKIKPLHVFHRNGRSEPDICSLDENQAREVRGQVSLQDGDVKSLLRNADAYVLFSGGRDSLCTLDYLATIASSIGREITAIHVDTTAGFPEVTQYVKSVCQQLEVPLVIVKPEIDFFTMAKEWGIPGINSRWCCRELKIRPLAAFLAKMDNPKIVFDGIRAVESPIRAKYLPVWFHPSFNCLSVSPIFDWGDEKIDMYTEERGLPSGPWTELGTSGECWCGAYKKKADFEQLYHLHPEIYYKLMEVERANKHGFTFVYEDGQRIPLVDLEKAIQEDHERKTSG